jgi:dTDP-4-dehydrorhamnose reductase
LSPLKVLLTGGSGLLGQYLNISLSSKYELITTYYSEKRNCINYNYRKLNLENNSEIIRLFNEIKPDIIIHAGGVSNSNIADELGKELTYKINAEAAKIISDLCNQNNTKLIYISTDLVYDGEQGEFLTESAELNPKTVYAESKLAAEFEVQKLSSNYLILRMALMFGNGLNGSQNFFTFMIDNLKNQKPVKLFVDQYRTPLELSDSARMITELLDKKNTNEIINFGGRERISRYDLGELVCNKYDFDPSYLIKTKMSEIPNYTEVADVSMNTDKLSKIGIQSKNLIDVL